MNFFRRLFTHLSYIDIVIRTVHKKKFLNLRLYGERTTQTRVGTESPSLVTGLTDSLRDLRQYAGEVKPSLFKL